MAWSRRVCRTYRWCRSTITKHIYSGVCGCLERGSPDNKRQKESTYSCSPHLRLCVLFGCWGASGWTTSRPQRALAYTTPQVLHISWHPFTNHKMILLVPDLFSNIFSKPIKRVSFSFILFEELWNANVCFLHIKKKKVKCAFKQKCDVKYEFWPFDIIPNINRPVLSASLFVLWNECTLAGCTVRTLMLCPSCWTLWLLRPVEGWHLCTGCFYMSKQKPGAVKKTLRRGADQDLSCWFQFKYSIFWPVGLQQSSFPKEI